MKRPKPIPPLILGAIVDQELSTQFRAAIAPLDPEDVIKAMIRHVVDGKLLIRMEEQHDA